MNFLQRSGQIRSIRTKLHIAGLLGLVVTLIILLLFLPPSPPRAWLTLERLEGNRAVFRLATTTSNKMEFFNQLFLENRVANGQGFERYALDSRPKFGSSRPFMKGPDFFLYCEPPVITNAWRAGASCEIYYDSIPNWRGRAPPTWRERLQFFADRAGLRVNLLSKHVMIWSDPITNSPAIFEQSRTNIIYSSGLR